MSRARDLANFGNNAGGLETLTVSDITDLTATATELNKLSGVTATKDELNLVDGSVSGPLNHRNMIINGAMQVHQRVATNTLVQASHASTTTGFTVDRFKYWESTDGTYQTKHNAVTDLAGFTSSLYLSPDAADTSIAAGQYALVGQTIEAQDLQHIGIGTSSSKTLTLSFYIKSNLTGKMSAYIAKYDNGTRIVPLEFDLPSSAGDWERIELTVPALTSGGIINNDNGLGFEVIWALTVGDTYKIGTSGTWGSNANGLSTSNHNVNFMSSTSNYIELTGVQLELGSVATPFETRSYADELQRCLRYYEKIVPSGSAYVADNSNSSTLGYARINGTYLVTKRAAPTIGGSGFAIGGSANMYAGYSSTVTTVFPTIETIAEL